MTNRPVTIDEVIEKIGAFSAQDAIDLIESSQNTAFSNGTRGHPLQHCEMTTRNWSGPARFMNAAALVTPRGSDPGDVYKNPENAATELNKPAHTMSWTDQHLIQAVRDLFLGNGAFTALHQLRTRGAGFRLVFLPSPLLIPRW